MKTNMQEYNGTLIITSPDGKFRAEIEVQTGQILMDETPDVTIDELHRFTHAARSRYRKFLNSKAADSFID
ncbi:hypothetical protein P59_128 [Bacillus phage P59]|nr:hypothetical protein P59_128 [Bacillus phage P59]